MSASEIIQLNKLQKYANNDIFVNVVYRIKLVKPSLCLKEGVDEEQLVSPTDDTSNKNVCYLAVLKIFKLHKTILNK